ncbi:U3 small nucleolar RNA-associated protein 4 homolog [Euwallacea similis]|uniref:U3 small nucleolar RNA-associated protein 4 homolog n=1 Tax=Euwallacea similis TaxID=1736056 RepID=UPI00344CC29A
MPQCTIHNVGFYRPEAHAIYCMALNPKSRKLAVARADASVEIWNLMHTPFVEKTFPPHFDNFTIEGLAWSNGRLFSVGLHGSLIEFDLYSLTIKGKWSITGEAGTCLDCHQNMLAIGTEQGYINIFRADLDGAVFEKFLDKQEGRLLCLKYSPDGQYVVAGSINAVRIWNVKTGHAIHKMVLGRSESKKDTVVWCLHVFSDLTIFSGDSRGVLTLWDGKLGAQIESYQSHQADITALCVDDKEESVYCAGVDPLISNYEKVKVGTNTKWVKSIQRKIHDHDVRALVFFKDRLYSAGLDSYLVCSYHPPKTLIKYAPIAYASCAHVASGRDRRILLKYTKHVEVWSLAGLQETQEKPRKLVIIQRIGKNWEDEDEAESVLCASMSRDGKWIFVATYSGFRLYRLDMKKGEPRLDKMDLDDNLECCVQAAFNDKHQQLFTALSTGKLIVYDVVDNDPFISQRIDLKTCGLADTVSLLTTSGKHVVVADAKSNIATFRHTKDGYSFEGKLPRFEAGPTALAVNCDNLVVAYADNKVFEYSLIDRRSTGLSSRLDDSWKSRTHPIRSITFDAQNNIFLHDDSSIFVINKSPDSSSSSPGKKIAKKAKEVSLTNGELEDLRISTIPKHKHLVHLAALSEGEFVAVEVNPLSLLEKLPPAFAQKTFGSK